MEQTTTELPRLSKHALFGLLGYEPHPGQLLVHRSRAERRVLACGSRWGKSLCAAMETCAALLEPRELCLGWVVAPTRDLADRIFLRVADTLKTKLPHRLLELDLRGQKLTVANLAGGTSELRGKSADMPVTLLGEALDFLIVDEAAKMRDDIWPTFLSPRLVDRRGWALILSTPAGANWFHEVYRRGQKNRDAAFESWASPTSANLHIDPAVIEAERGRMAEDAFEEAYEARFLGADPEPCDLCGGPRRGAMSLLIMWDGGKPSRCRLCGEYVHEDGTTAVDLNPDGKTRTKVVIIRGVEDEESPSPAEAAPARKQEMCLEDDDS